MPNDTHLDASLDGIEIGATGPRALQMVLSAEGHSVTLRLTADEARFLAHALTHWADVSETMAAN